MSLKHGLLGLLKLEGPTTGYELDKLFKETLNYFWQANTSQIYRELNAMERAGWLESERVMQEEKPNKRVYTITQEGDQELKSWLLSPHTISGSIKSSFLMRIFFSGEVGEEAVRKLLYDYRDKCKEYIEPMEVATKTVAEEGPENPKHEKYWKIVVMHGEMQLKASIEWAEKAIALLEEV